MDTPFWSDGLNPTTNAMTTVVASTRAVWRPEVLPRLEKLVLKSHRQGRYASDLAEVLIFKEVDAGNVAGIPMMAGTRFFTEVWLGLAKYRQHLPRTAETRHYRHLLASYVPKFLKATGYKKPWFPSPNRVSASVGGLCRFFPCVSVGGCMRG